MMALQCEAGALGLSLQRNGKREAGVGQCIRMTQLGTSSKQLIGETRVCVAALGFVAKALLDRNWLAESVAYAVGG